MGAAGKRSVIADEKGVALLLTITIVSLLVGITMMFHRESWRNYHMADSYKTNGYLRSIAESGINIGMELLSRKRGGNPADSLLDSWATLEKEMLAPLFDTGELELVVKDLSGRLQINSLVKTGNAAGKNGESSITEDLKKILYQLLLSEESLLTGESGARDIVDALVDWIDSDDIESDYGVESSYYRTLDPPYECRNGPVQSIEELLFVRGMTPRILFGDGRKRGLADFITVCGGDGRININTMDPLLLQGMSLLIDSRLAAGFDAFRKNEGNKGLLADPLWYKKVASWPGDIVLNEKLLTTKSSCFLIHSTGRNGSRSYQISASVRRNEDGTMEIIRRTVK